MLRLGRLILPAVAALLVVTAAVLLISRSAVTVLDRAAEQAGAAPYCVQVAARGSDYRPARALTDLTKLTMWAEREGGMFMQRHAMLVVGSLTAPQRFYWSYRKNNFVADENANPNVRDGIACEPVQDFAAKLPVVNTRATRDDFIWFSPRESYRISREYQAQWRGAGLRSSIYIIAPAPAFLPETKTVATLRTEGNLFSQWVFMQHNPEWLLSLMQAPPRNNTRYISEGTEYGLSKIKTIFTGQDGREYPGYIFTTGDKNTEHATYIGCGPRSCQHRFLSEGRHFSFDHKPENVREWRAMQERILVLFENFASGRRAPEL